MKYGSHHFGGAVLRSGVLGLLLSVVLGGLLATAAYIWHIYRLVVMNG